MVTTKHCCWGDCKSDSRTGNVNEVYFIGFGNGFPKPNKEEEKCKQWVNSCGRKHFTIKNVNKDTYICSLHFIGGKGPTTDNPDPIICGKEVTRKRKAPRDRPDFKSTKQRRLDRIEAAEALVLLPGSSTNPTAEATFTESFTESSNQAPCSNSEKFIATPIYHEPLFKDVGTMCQPDSKSTSSQTQKTSEVIKLSIQNKILENDLITKQSEFEIKKPVKSTTTSKTSFHDSFGVDSVKDDDIAFKFYTGLTFAQFLCLWEFLGESTKKINYWNTEVNNPDQTPSKRPGRRRKLTPKDELFMTLIRLRLGLLHQDLAYRFKTNTRQVSTCIITWIQLLYKQFSTIRAAMFATRDKIRKHLPKSFKKYKNIRCIIDCTEVFVQQPGNFAAAGNQYSSYKGHATFKFLVAIAPNGAIVFISDAYEGSISDKDIVSQSGFLDFLNPGDVIMADRGFLINEMLNDRHVKMVRPPFLGSRHSFTPQEEAATKDIAKHRIHVERAIERMKKYKILQKIIPQKLQPVFSQCVFVIGCLVNFQSPLVT